MSTVCIACPSYQSHIISGGVGGVPVRVAPVGHPQDLVHGAQAGEVLSLLADLAWRERAQGLDQPGDMVMVEGGEDAQVRALGGLWL